MRSQKRVSGRFEFRAWSMRGDSYYHWLTFLPLQDEVRRWILPGVSEDPIQSETNHLMKIGDDDKVMTSSNL